MTEEFAIEICADLWCPFAYAGLRSAIEVRDDSDRPETPIWVRSWPLEKINGAPLDPETTRSHAHELREQVVPELFSHVDEWNFPVSTLEPLALVARGYRVSPRIGEALSVALRTALFEEGRNISDMSVLEEFAARFETGLPDDEDRAAVFADYEEGRSRGVQGSPHFFCGDQGSFCPSLQITREPEGGLHIASNSSRLRTFLNGCLSPSPARKMWEERYDGEDYVYGTDPNGFLAEHLADLPGENVLCLAEGEGRHAVFLAKRGKIVTSVDLTSNGVEKTRWLAKHNGVVVNAIQGDLAHFDLGVEKWDVIISIFAHMPPEVRRDVHRRVVSGLRPGGVFLLEAYRPEQVGRGTGGPPTAEMMMSLAEVEEEVQPLTITFGEETERDVIEGTGHTGRGAVVQLIAQKT